MDGLKRLAKERDRKHLIWLFTQPRYYGDSKRRTFWCYGDCTPGTHEHTVLYPRLPENHLEERQN